MSAASPHHEINQELHARPYVRLSEPAHVLHLAFLHPPGAPGLETEGRAALVAALQMRDTYETSRHSIHAADLPGVGRLVLAWACHTSYTTYTLYLYGLKEAYQPSAPFAYDLRALLPAGWLEARRDALLHLTRLSVFAEREVPATFEHVATYFDRNVLRANHVMGQAGTAWSDYRLDDDGCGRLLLLVREMTRHELGRTVQRLLNVEDHYHLVLLALPAARELQGRLTQAEAQLNETMKAISAAETMADKRLRLAELMALAVEIEHDLAVHTARFSPAFSYFSLLKGSYEELRESKVPGLLPMSVFVLRRVNPAVQTYTSLQARLEAMSQRIARAADLLRTAIELNLGEQNQHLLTRLDQRARLQLRLQETVEGLSVIAISYYLLGLLGYGVKGLKAAGWHVDPEVAIAWALPVVLAGVWGAGRFMRGRLRRDP